MPLSHSDGDVREMQTTYIASFFFQQRQAVFNQAVSNDSQSSQEQRVNMKINTSSVSLSLRYSFKGLSRSKTGPFTAKEIGLYTMCILHVSFNFVHVYMYIVCKSCLCRFPVPEMNESQRRLPWYHPSLRQEVLYVTLSHLTITSTLHPHLPHTSTVYDAHFTRAEGK